MGRRRDTPDFTRSNKFPALEYRPKAQERELTRKLIESQSAREREALGQELLDSICRSLEIPRARLRVINERQPHEMYEGKLAYKLYGVYHCRSAMIEIANLTSIRKQVVAGKTFLDTLIHELMHHIDRKFLRIPSTPHSPGFYARIEDLKAKLMRMRGGDRTSPQETAWQRPRDLTAALESAISSAQAGNAPQNPGNPVPAARPETRKPRWTPPGESELPTHAKPEESSATEKPPRTEEEPASANHPQKGASGEKEPQLSFDFR